MRLILHASLLLVAALGAVPAASQTRVPRIAVVATHNHFDLLAAARAYDGELQVDVFGTSNEPGLQPARETPLEDYDLVFAEGGGSQFLFLLDALEQAKSRTKVLVIRTDLIEGNINAAEHPWVEKYWDFPSATNLRRLLGYFGARILGGSMAVEAPTEYPTAGFYHPEAPRFFESLSAYRSWYDSARPRIAGAPSRRPVIGIAFHSRDHLRDQTEPVDALVREVEAQGGMPAPLMFSGAIPLEQLQDEAGAVDAVITTSSRIDWYNTEAGVAAARSLGVPLLSGIHHYRLTPQEWRDSQTGLAPDLTRMTAMSERDGLIEPIVISAKVASPETGDTKEALGDQVAWRVRRAIAWANLRRESNAEKRVVVTFHAEGGGKGDVGSDLDDYLDVQGSLVEITRAMRERGYDLGSGDLPDLRTVTRDLSLRASNIGNWAPGELARRAAAGDVELIPEETYRRWFDELPAEKREQVTAMWGPPPGDIMVYVDEAGRRFLALPRVEYGNLLVAAHPDWGHLQNKRALFAREELPPHHQYIAFFLWLQREYKADFWLNLFSNIVLQGGKMEGPAAGDWTALLQGDIPHLRATALHGNGSVSNKRRALAVAATFSPSIVYSDLYGELLEIQAKLIQYRNQADGAVRASYEQSIRDEAVRLRLDRDLEIDAARLPIKELVGRLEEYLAGVRREHMPGGSHVLGVAPSGEKRVEMVTAMLGREFTDALESLAPDDPAIARRLVAAVIEDGRSPQDAQQEIVGRSTPLIAEALALAPDYAARLDATPQELSRILDVLDGRYMEPGPINDPVRNPDALPSGRNAYLFDPGAMPTREAWKTAGLLADQLLEQYQAKHGELPRKVGFVLWSGDTDTTLGVNEAQMLHLLGVRPVWDSRGRVVDVELIPSAELGRPRIDVFATTSGTYRDHYLDKMIMLDKAVKLAAAASAEPDNGVAARTAEIRAALLASGESAQTADRLATARVFSEAVGSYSPNIQFLAKSGDFYESTEQMTELYGNRLSHVYGDGQIGSFHRQVFSENLRSLDAAAFSRASNVLKTLDHPMVAAYFGGMAMASRSLSGKSPEMFISNLADPGAARTETLSQYFNRELRSRYFNPKWVSNMMERGYEGSRYPAAFTSHLQLWDTTTPELVESDHWREVRDIYVRDKHGLGLNAFFEEHNPFAKQSLTATLLDAAAHGQWEATEADRQELARILAESAIAHGLACEAELCRNRKLVGEMREALGGSADTAALFEAFQAALEAMQAPQPLSAAPAAPAPEQSAGQPVPATAAQAARTEAAPPTPPVAAQPPVAPNTEAAESATVEGRVLETASAPPADRRDSSAVGWASGLALALSLLGLGWRRGGQPDHCAVTDLPAPTTPAGPGSPAPRRSARSDAGPTPGRRS